MKKNITVLTATRAEYGLLRPLILKLKKCDRFIVNIIVTGAHLSPEFGLTYKNIENDGIEIDEKIPILLSSDTPSGVSKTMGLGLISFGDYFERKKSDLLILLGDRYETLAVACAALNARVPIAHLYGGETTEGAVDEAYRHAITKMSYLHFTSTNEYRKRVIQLGESPDRVYTVGGIGVENAINTKFLSKDELSESINFELDKPFAVVTFHPVTLENSSAEQQIESLLAVIEKYTDMKFIITGANADVGGRIINQKVSQYVKTHSNAISIESLGINRYLSALHYAEMVIGNSSSGLIEVPSFGIPTINIGDRQKGRLMASSVINCEPSIDSIEAAVKKALSPDFRKIAAETVNPYGDGDTSDKIIDIISDYLVGEINLKKKFYNIDFEV